MVTGLATLNGNPVVVIANNPSYKDGFLCTGAAKKAIFALETAAIADLPVITLVDGNGIGDSKNFEEKGFSRVLARLASEYAKRAYFNKPTVTVTLGASYGTAYTVMGSKSLTGGIALALDRARISAMNPDSAVAFLDEVKNEAKHKETAKAWAERYASPLEAAKSGHIDDIIDSAELRQRIGAALEMLL
jgi:acetyl-CoA carboxylase carboxyltransferase component